MRKIVYLLPLLLLCNSVYAQTWQQVPLRTSAQQAAGFFGGEGFQAVQDIKYAPSNPNILYMIIDTMGPWKGTDNGTKITWQPIINGFGAMGGQSLGVHPTNSNTVFVAGSPMYHQGSSPEYSLKGIFRTTDGGSNWSLVKATTYQRDIRCKGANLFAFSGASTVYAGTHGAGLLRSTDGGTTWTTIVSSPSYITDIKIHPGDSTILYMCTTSGLYRVEDSGAITTTRIGLALPRYPFQIAIDKNNPSTLYVTLSSYGVYRSTDGGTNFSARNNGMAATIAAGHSAYSISISPADPNYLYVSYAWENTISPYGYFYSHDGGANWYSPINMDMNNYIGSFDAYYNAVKGHTYVTPTAVHPTNKDVAIALCNGEQPRRTTDGGQYWMWCGDKYTGGLIGNNGVITPIGWDSDNHSKFMFFLGDFGPFLTTDGGSTFTRRKTYGWSSLGWGSTNGGAIVPNTDIVVAASGDWATQRLMVTRNLGVSWTEISGTDAFYRFISVHPTNTNVVYAGKYKFTSIQTNNNYSTLSKTVWGMYRGNGNIVYSVGWVSGVTTVYKSTDGGTSWTTPYPSIPASGQIGQVAIAPDDENRIYVVMKGTTPSDGAGIWIINNTSANGGTATLKNYNHGLSKDQFDEMNYYSVAVDPGNPNILYAGQYSAYKGAANGIFQSLDYGNTWSNISGNLTSWFTPICITVDPFSSYVYVGSFFGTWKLPPPSGEPEPPTILTYDVEKINAGAVTVDGNLSEWELHNSIGKTLSGAPVSIGTWSAKWSVDGLYVAAQISDDTLVVDSGAAQWQDDGIEIYLSRDRFRGTPYNEQTRHLVLNAYGTSTWVDTTHGGTNVGIVVGTSTAGALYRYEVYIPWANFSGGAIPTYGESLPFDMQLNDDNNGGTREGNKSWNNTVDTNYYDTSNFGEIELQDYASDVGCVVSSQDLVGHFSMNAGTGTNVVDCSLNNNTGTITGAIFASGKIGNALDFDGVDDSASFPNEDLYDFQRTDAFSITAWVKISALVASDNVIVTKILHSSPYSGYMLYVAYPGNIAARLCNTYSTNMINRISVTIDDDLWHHIGFTYSGNSDASGLNIYVDGALSNGTVTSNTLSASILNNQKLTIGNHGGGGGPTNGLIDDVRIYKRELSSGEINCLYNDTTPLSVQSTEPGSASTGIAVNTDVDVTFNETLDANFVGTATVSVGTVTGAVSSGTGTVKFNPAGDLNSNTTYPVSLSLNLRDSAGNPMLDNYTYHFTTIAGTDTTAPIGTITLNNDAPYATSTSIMLDLAATDSIGVTGYFLSTGSTTPYATQTGWVMVGTSTNYAGKIPYILSFIDGVKTIFGWFRDGAGNISSVTQDSVVLDTVFASVVINDPSQNCSLADGTAVYGTSGSSVDIGGLAYDVNGVSQVKVSHVEFATVNSATGTDTWVRSNNIIGTTSANTLLATAYDVPGNQGTATIRVGNYAVPAILDITQIEIGSAQLNVSVLPNIGNTCTAYCEYGLVEGKYSSTTPVVQVVGAPGTTTPQLFDVPLVNLNANTEYFCRLRAVNAIGETVGSAIGFRTAGGLGRVYGIKNNVMIIREGSRVYNTSGKR